MIGHPELLPGTALCLDCCMAGNFCCADGESTVVPVEIQILMDRAEDGSVNQRMPKSRLVTVHRGVVFFVVVENSARTN